MMMMLLLPSLLPPAPCNRRCRCGHNFCNYSYFWCCCCCCCHSSCFSLLIIVVYIHWKKKNYFWLSSADSSWLVLKIHMIFSTRNNDSGFFFLLLLVSSLVYCCSGFNITLKHIKNQDHFTTGLFDTGEAWEGEVEEGMDRKGKLVLFTQICFLFFVFMDTINHWYQHVKHNWQH